MKNYKVLVCSILFCFFALGSNSGDFKGELRESLLNLFAKQERSNPFNGEKLIDFSNGINNDSKTSKTKKVYDSNGYSEIQPRMIHSRAEEIIVLKGKEISEFFELLTEQCKNISKKNISPKMELNDLIYIGRITNYVLKKYSFHHIEWLIHYYDNPENSTKPNDISIRDALCDAKRKINLALQDFYKKKDKMEADIRTKIFAANMKNIADSISGSFTNLIPGGINVLDKYFTKASAVPEKTIK